MTGPVPAPALAAETARAGGERMARQLGVADVRPGDTRFRIVSAEIGAVVAALHDPDDGRHVATLSERQDGWWAVDVSHLCGQVTCTRPTFARAVASGLFAGALLAVRRCRCRVAGGGGGGGGGGGRL